MNKTSIIVGLIGATLATAAFFFYPEKKINPQCEPPKHLPFKLMKVLDGKGNMLKYKHTPTGRCLLVLCKPRMSGIEVPCDL